MNLKSNKARASIAALGACTLVVGGGWLASTAIGAGETLAFGPTGTSATIVDAVTTPGTNSVSAGLTYGVKVTGMSGSDPVYASVISAPTSASAYFERVANNGAPTANATFTQVQDSGPANVQVTTTAGSTTATISNTPASPLASALIRLTGASGTEYKVASSSGTTLTLASPAKYSQTTTTFASAGAAASNNFFVPVAESATSVVPGYASGDNVYFGAVTPGAYTFRLFQDHNGNGAYEPAQDDSTSVFTLNVKDVTAATTSTSDDLSFGLTADTSVALGNNITATATLGGLSTQDTRGTSSGVGVLGTKVASATQFDGTATTTTVSADASPTFDGTNFTHNFTTSGAAGSFAIQPVFDQNASGTFSGTDYIPTGQSTNTTVTSNGVTAVADTVVTDVTGSVKGAANAATIKTGVSQVTYTATVTDAGTKTDDVVFFTLTPGTNTPTLTADGTLVSNTSGVKVYSATANSDGVATLKVTSSDTTANTTYTVGAKSNAATSANLTATYAAAAFSSLSITNTAVELTPTVGSSVTLKGKLLDQFDGTYVPAVSSPQSVQLFLGTNAASCSAVSFAAPKATNTTDANIVLSNGTFSYSYTPASTPSAGTCTSFGVGYDANTGGTIAAGEADVDTINWASSTAAASITAATPNAGATKVNLSDDDTVVPGQSNATTGATGGADTDDFGDADGQITGTVYDAGNTPLAYKSVTITGSTGVYFTDAATPSATHQLATSWTAVTNGSGALSGVYAFFTKSGTATITLTSGSATKTVSVTTDDASDPYKIVAIDAKGKPGTTIAVTGNVKDMFGNAVVNQTVDLTLSDNSVGVLADAHPETDSNGVWSTTISPATNQEGDVTVTAVINGQTQNATPAALWATAGLTYAHGEYMDQSTISVGETALTISSSGRLTYGSKYYARGALISGTADAGATVEIWGKTTSSSYQLMDTATADDNGEFGTTIKIARSVWFIAKSDGKTSASSLTKVYSAVSLSAKSNSADHVTLTANGGPNAKGTLTFYRVYADGHTKKLGSMTSSSYGNGSKTFSAPSGNRKFKVVFQAPGTYSGSDTDYAKVK
ncbi:beta strand repeat-containing protein [Spongisporangium articulatum]|uniref:Beta strand repeat-containing protein n=1 Tax=Spongisporangium articulatum TaxID=3362603 RepID=A0ABW8AHT5_9ACTN